VMGVGYSFGEAFVKSQLAAGVKLPKGGRAFISVRDADKLAAVDVARELTALGFTVLATRGTAAALVQHGVAVTAVNKVAEGRPHIVDMMKNGEVSLIINTLDPHQCAGPAHHLLHDHGRGAGGLRRSPAPGGSCAL